MRGPAIVTSGGEQIAGRPDRALRAGLVAGIAFGFIGWRGLLVPSLIRSIEATFAQTDAGLGGYFFVTAATFAAGSLAAGPLVRRLGHRASLGLAGVVIAGGLAGQGVASTWPLFVIAGASTTFGAAIADVGINALFLDLYPGSRGRALNLLHLAFSLAALATPLAVALLVTGGVDWQAVVLGSGVAWLVVAGALVVATPGGLGAGATPTAEAAPGSRPRRLPIPLLLMAAAIGCYVASEGAVSDWLVRFLDALPVTLASVGLTLFWAGITVGRIAFARIGNRLEPIRAATAMVVVGAGLQVAAILAPEPHLSLVLFGAVGVAFGPVYPLIVAAAGARMPGRSATVGSTMAFAAVVGAIVYPPAVGILSVGVGMRVALLGTAALALLSGLALIASRRTRER